MWRKLLFGVNSFRLINRLTEVGEIPPKYAHASFSFNAPWGTVVAVW